VQTVEGSVEILGRPAKSILYSPSTYNDGLRNYWSTNLDGDVLLHGAFSPMVGQAYDPPMVILDPPLWVGKTWSQTVDLHSLPGGEYVGEIEFTMQVTDETDLTVPAGTFHCFGITLTSPTSPSGGDPLPALFEGVRASGSTGSPADVYFAEGVGMVRYGQSDNYYELLGTTEIERDTWGGIKSLFR
jgi:hypothetical protein